MARDMAWHYLTARQRAAQAAEARRAARAIDANEPRIAGVPGSSSAAFAAAAQSLAADLLAPSRHPILQGMVLATSPFRKMQQRIESAGLASLQNLLHTASRKLAQNGLEQRHPSVMGNANFAPAEWSRADRRGDDLPPPAERKTATR